MTTWVALQTWNRMPKQNGQTSLPKPLCPFCEAKGNVLCARCLRWTCRDHGIHMCAWAPLAVRL